MPQAFGNRQDLVRVLHHADTHLTQQVYRHLVAACQGAGVRAGRFLPLLCGAGFVHHHRLVRRDLASHIQKAPSIPKPFHVKGRHSGMRVLTEIAQVVVETNVALVTGANIATESYLAVMLCFQGQRQQHIARLRDDTDIACPDIGQVQQVDALMQVEQTGGVGADDAHPMRLGRRHHRFLQGSPCRSGFAEPAGQHYRALDPLTATLGDQRRYAGSRGTQQSQLRRTRHVRQ